MKKVLNVGGNNKLTPLPPQYAEFEHLLLDIDPKGKPDILCDARNLRTFRSAQFDAVYCAHNLEHYYRHDALKVLQGFFHVLTDDGFVEIRIPDIYETMRVAISKGLDLDDILYQSLSAGPIRVVDTIYGFAKEIARSGNDFYAHKTAFTINSLSAALKAFGFKKLYGMTYKEMFEIRVFAFKQTPDDAMRALFDLPAD